MQERYEVFKTVAELVEFMLVREHRGMWFFAHAGGLSDMEFVLDELLSRSRMSSPPTAGRFAAVPGGLRGRNG